MPKRLIPTLTLAAYSALLVRLMVFKISFLKIGHLRLRMATHPGPPNLIPFKSIAAGLRGEPSRMLATVNLIGNIALLAPIGFLAPFVLPAMGWRTALLLGTAAGLILETMELVFQVGIFDVDDIMLNATGVMLGYAVCRAFRQRRDLASHNEIA